MANYTSDDELAKYLVSNYSVSNGEANHLAKFIKLRDEQVAREAYIAAKDVVLRKRDVYLTYQDVTETRWMAIRDQLRNEICVDLEKRIEQLTTTHIGRGPGFTHHDQDSCGV